MYSQKIIQHPDLGDVVLRVSSRASRISLSVRPSGEVRLVLPLSVSESTALSFLDSRLEWIKASQVKLSKLCEDVVSVSESTEEEFHEICAQAREYLPQRIREISKITNLKFGRLTLSSARTRWGSCSSRCDISLSVYLMKLPKNLIDLVIVHELCHTIHHNHSAQFHELVDRLLGGREKELERELKRYSAR